MNTGIIWGIILLVFGLIFAVSVILVYKTRDRRLVDSYVEDNVFKVTALIENINKCSDLKRLSAMEEVSQVVMEAFREGASKLSKSSTYGDDVGWSFQREVDKALGRKKDELSIKK